MNVQRYIRPCALAAVLFASSTIAAARQTAITCVNPVSGTRWQIHIDYDRKQVDSNPADINAARISWRDARDGNNYTLDRRTGALTMVAASSTGGYFLHHRCQLAKPE